VVDVRSIDSICLTLCEVMGLGGSREGIPGGSFPFGFSKQEQIGCILLWQLVHVCYFCDDHLCNILRVEI